MKLSNKEIDQIIHSISSIKEKELPIKTLFKITCIAKKLEPLVQAFDEIRKQITNKYAVLDANGEVVVGENQSVEIENYKGFQNDINELLNIECSVDIEKLSLSDFENVQISPEVAIPLSYIIQE